MIIIISALGYIILYSILYHCYVKHKEAKDGEEDMENKKTSDEYTNEKSLEEQQIDYLYFTHM